MEGAGTGGVSEVITGVTGALSDFSTTTLTTVIVAALGITVTLVIGWFAYRFITRKASGALRKGKL